jgi:hypothetical protein
MADACRVRMPIDSARAFFQAVAARGREPLLADAVGTWEFDIGDAGSWTIDVDRGALHVSERAGSVAAGAGGPPISRLHMAEPTLVRLAKGEGHENLLTALLRGALVVDGEISFLPRLQAILPIPAEWKVGT